MRRTIVIGDVHGCVEELAELLRACGHTSDDRVILVGDLVAKGPDSQAVVQFAREVGADAVRGNHEEHVLRWRRSSERSLDTLRPEHRKVAQSLTEADWSWLDSRPVWIRLPEENALVVHAGLVPGRPLEEQRVEDLLNLRSITPEGRASKRVDDGVPWASVWKGPVQVLFGHDALRGLQRHPHALGLDSGCVYGRELTACLLPERRMVSVRAKRDWNSLD